MKRTISTTGLLLASISAILGSGWLFSAFYVAKLAGPAGLLSWAIGGIFITIIAFVFAEICSMIPVSGSSVKIPQFTHGTLVSFIFSWIVWLSYIALTSTEVQAMIQYASFYYPQLTHSSGGLTGTGYIIATILLLALSAFNVYSVRWLIRCNSILTIFKLIIPIFIVIVILMYFFTPQHAFHPGHSKFLATSWHGVFAALTGGGILFAFNGFKQSAELAGEVKRPQFSVPFGIIGSIVITFILFILIQTAFFSSLNIHNLIHGWSHLTLGHSSASPLAAILLQDHRRGLLPILYAAAIIAPLGASLIYCACAGRALHAMSHSNYIPAIFKKITPQGNAVYATLFNFFCCLLLFAPLPGWSQMVTFLASLLAITYAIGPINLVALRHQAPNLKRTFKLPFGYLWSFVAFYICTLLVYWSNWHILSKMSITVAVGFIVLMLCRLFNKRSRQIKLNWFASTWIWPYFGGLLGLSYLGGFGGIDYLSDAEAYGLIAVFCLIIFLMAIYFKLPAEETQRYISKLKQWEQREKVTFSDNHANENQN